VHVGVLGLGTVGSHVVGELDRHAALFAARVGEEVSVRRILVRDRGKTRPGDVLGRLTFDPDDILRDPDIELVVELMGGQEPARTMIGAALGAGKSVVTANKEVIARDGLELARIAERGDLRFEAAVAGGIPIVRALQESLAGNRLQAIYGIVNGTTNFILSRMQQGDGPEEALAEAKRLGYAEADPTDDLCAADAARKIAILASLAFDGWVDVAEVAREGIVGVGEVDVAEAAALGGVIKLLARAEATEDGLALGVSPTLIPKDHPLAAVGGVQNAIYVRGEPIGELLFEGPGAGGPATSSAVLGDIVEAARARRAGGSRVRLPREPAPLVELGAHRHSYYLRLRLRDEAGALALVAEAFARAGVSLRSVHQPLSASATALVSLLTGPTTRGQLDEARLRLRRSPSVVAEESLLLAELEHGLSRPRPT